MANCDEWDEVVNGEDTYTSIRKELQCKENVLIGWTNGIDHYDILFSHSPSMIFVNRHTIQGGLARGYHLFVSIMRHGAFGFSTNEWHSGSYVAEKLCLNDELGEQIASLINGVLGVEKK